MVTRSDENAGAAGRSSKRALVFRSEYLQNSETFIADHLRSLRDWQAVPVCTRLVPNTHADLPLANPVLKDGRGLGAFQRLALSRLGLNRRLSQVCRRNQPGLLHAHFLTDAATVMRFARRNNLPLVATAHGYDASMTDAALSAWDEGEWLVRHRRELARTVSVILCVSNFIKQELLSRGFPAEKLIVQHLGVDVEALKADRPAGQCEGVLFVGRLVEKKGAENLIEAWRLLPESLRKQGLTIVGAGPREEAVRHLAAGHPEIALLGAQPRARVLEQMQRHRIFALPSQRAGNGDSEGLPIVTMEAQALGRPVVVFDDGPMPEAIETGVTGHAARKGDLGDYAAALARLLENASAASRMGMAGEKRARVLFDLRANTARLEKIYEAVVAG